MVNDDKRKELQDKISALAAELEKFRQQIFLLQQELKTLHPEEPIKDNSKIYTAEKIRPGFSFENFVGLKLIHFVGIIILVAGVGIGVKYAVDKELISEILRIILAYMAAGLLLFIALRLREKYQLFSMILFGGAMATAYFTTYGAFAYYGLLSGGAAFAVMTLLTCLTVYQALRFNRQEMAILALTGAYGIPLLVRGDKENALLLFSYILMINIGVLFLLFKKYWSSLIYLSFSITWIIFFTWAFFKVNPDREVGITFATLFFIVFAVGAIAFKVARGLEINRGAVIIFLLNLLAFYFALIVLRSSTIFKYPTTLTFIFALASVLGSFIVKYRIPAQTIFRNSLLLFGLLMLIIFVPMYYDRLGVTFVWVLMAVILFLVGVWQKYKLLRVCAIGLFGITLFKLIVLDSLSFTALQKIIAYISIGTILLIISFLYQKYKHIIFGDDQEN